MRSPMASSTRGSGSTSARSPTEGRGRSMRCGRRWSSSRWEWRHTMRLGGRSRRHTGSRRAVRWPSWRPPPRSGSGGSARGNAIRRRPRVAERESSWSPLARRSPSVLVALGGSASNDGGAGALAEIEEAGGLGGARLTCLCDVATPWELASELYGPQKGADAETVNRLEARLEALAAGAAAGSARRADDGRRRRARGRAVGGPRGRARAEARPTSATRSASIGARSRPAPSSPARAGSTRRRSRERSSRKWPRGAGGYGCPSTPSSARIAARRGAVGSWPRLGDGGGRRRGAHRRGRRHRAPLISRRAWPSSGRTPRR